MEALAAPKHHEAILKALTQVPIATTRQLATLNASLDPNKKASRLLRELEDDKQIQSRYHGQQKIWRLRRTPMRLPTKIDHALAVINLYFALRPKYWMYEPVERFNHLGRDLVWAPDCIFVHQKKVYVCELQLTPMTGSKWARSKWAYYNTYFNAGLFKYAAFQRWSDKTILPQFLVITSQQAETVKQGFGVEGREPIVSKSFKG